MCNEFYIGESGKSARIRITQHIRAIINFKPYEKYTNEVGYHFNLKNHNYKRDFQFFIFKCNVYTKIDRLSIETDLIHLVNMFNPPIINKKIPSRLNIKALAFLI